MMDSLPSRARRRPSRGGTRLAQRVPEPREEWRQGLRQIASGAALAALALCLGAAAAAPAQDTDKKALEQRVQDLEQELALVKRKLEVDAEASASKGPQPVLTAGSDGFALRSADSKYVLRLRGYTQFDSRWFTNTNDYAQGADSFYFRRIRPIFEGTLVSSTSAATRTARRR